MKNLFCIILLGFTLISVNAQESLIADIMNVTPVVLKADETTKEANDEFTKEFEEGKVKVDDLFMKHSEKFAGEVKELIERYNKVLAKGIEQDVSNEKQAVGTKVNALSMSLVRSKKEVLTQFNNEMIAKIRTLPKTLRDEKEEELGTAMEEFSSAIDAEFQANQQVIKAFRSTEHLTTDVSND